MLALIWVILALILYFAIIANVFDDDIIGSYALMRCGIGSLTCLFSRSLTPFLKGENRYLVIIVRDVVEQLIFLGALTTYYSTRTSDPTLTGAGYAFLISVTVTAIWMFIVIMKLSFLDVEYRGVVRFQFRRLSPIRPKILV